MFPVSRSTSVGGERCVEALEDAFGHHQRAVDVLGAREEDGELVAAETSDEVLGAHTRFQAPGRRFEQYVAGLRQNIDISVNQQLIDTTTGASAAVN